MMAEIGSRLLTQSNLLKALFSSHWQFVLVFNESQEFQCYSIYFFFTNYLGYLLYDLMYLSFDTFQV